jgi:hypothetical protein
MRITGRKRYEVIKEVKEQLQNVASRLQEAISLVKL